MRENDMLPENDMQNDMEHDEEMHQQFHSQPSLQLDDALDGAMGDDLPQGFEDLNVGLDAEMEEALGLGHEREGEGGRERGHGPGRFVLSFACFLQISVVRSYG